MFADYLEFRKFGLVQSDKGFATYSINGRECCLIDFFIKEKFRNSDVGSVFYKGIENLAAAKGCKYVSSQCDLKNTFPAEPPIAIHLKNGFQVVQADRNVLSFIKEL